ncbi:MAG: hypothetical protein H7Z13_19580 [Ferruginibacter sp.]|nr:hypothetical protein [Ferruginibacter sp.]
MKNFLFALVAGYIFALAVSNGAYAQKSVNTEVLEPQKNITAVEKTVTPVNARMDDIAAVSPKALKDFTRTYKNVSSERWAKIKDGFTARFSLNGINTLVYYDTKGRWAGSLKGYEEANLAREIRHIVKRVFYDYSITYVQEVETIDSGGKPTYIIHLEDNEHIRQVRIFEGQMEEWKEYDKQIL